MKCSDNDPLEVVYVDNHLLACIKRPGMPTQTHRKGEVSLEELAKEWVKRRFKKPGNVFLHAVHRLDKQVGGVVVFARTSKALARMHKMLRERRVEKRYVALVEGVPKKDTGELVHFLEHGEHRAHVAKGGKRSVLQYKVIKKRAGRALLEVHLITGRYHQIRAQLAAIGHPIVGDVKYGAQPRRGCEGIALMHAEISFEHPVTHEVVTLSVPCIW